MATLKFNNLQKIYPNNVQAVFDFNLEIKDKEFIVFVGPSGCGKSTTLRMVAGLEEISDGELFIDNKLVNFVDPKFRDIAMVFQSYALYPHMTVYDNIAFSLKIRKLDMTIYKKSEELDSLQKFLKTNRINLLKVNKKLAKKPNEENLLKKQKELKAEAFDLFNKIKKASTPIVGHSDLLEKRWGKKSVKCEKEILSLNKKITKLNGAKNVDSHYLNSLKIELLSKQKELVEAKKQADFFKNNEVNLVKFRHYTKNEIYESVLNAAEILDLFVYLERKPLALSGGQRQRVALGRAIVRKPKVFLMDEPLSNLDAKLRTQTRAEIAQIHKSVGATTIYVTHDQVEAMTLADRIVVMKDGYIQQVATPKEAFEKPSNMFVGGFIGSPAMNFIKGTFNGKSFIISNNNTQSKQIKFNLTKQIISKLSNYKGKEVFIGIRPEFVHLKSEFTEKGEVAEIELSINQLELVGHEFILYFKINDQQLSAKVKSDENLKEGKNYKFVIELDKVHFFDPETTNRI